MFNNHDHLRKTTKEDRELSTPNFLLVLVALPLSSFVVEQLIGVCMYASLKGPTKNQKKAQKKAKTN